MLTEDASARSAPGRPRPAPSPATVGPSTAAVHAGEAREKPGFSLTDPIYASSTYTFADTQAIIDFLEQKQTREEYGRYGNPGEKVVEQKLAALEGAAEAVLFASGMAAFVGLLKAPRDTGAPILVIEHFKPPTPEVLR